MLRLTAQFESENGTLSFTVKEGRPEDGGAPLPASFIKGILQALGQRQPEAWDTSKPIPLPFGIKRVWIDRHALCGET
jgi:hypothetical protein